MTYQQLLDALKLLTPEQLQQQVTTYASYEDRFVRASKIEQAGEANSDLYRVSKDTLVLFS